MHPVFFIRCLQEGTVLSEGTVSKKFQIFHSLSVDFFKYFMLAEYFNCNYRLCPPTPKYSLLRLHNSIAGQPRRIRTKLHSLICIVIRMLCRFFNGSFSVYSTGARLCDSELINDDAIQLELNHGFAPSVTLTVISHMHILTPFIPLSRLSTFFQRQ